MTSRASKDPHAAKPVRRRKRDIGPAPEQAPEDALYAQHLFQATPAEAAPVDQEKSSQPN
jgi:hypothetical protein